MTTLTTLTNTDTKLNLLHLSYFNYDPVDVFYPRIPTSRANDEDATVKRICTAPTLEGCLSAHPNLLYYAHGYMHSATADPFEHMARLHALLEHGLSGILLRVYHFEVDKEKVYTDDTLMTFDFVPDAHVTGEHWILEECMPTKVSYMLLSGLNETEEKDRCTPVYTLFETLEEIGTFMPYDDFYSTASKHPNANELLNKTFSKAEALSFKADAEERKQLLRLRYANQMAAMAESYKQQQHMYTGATAKNESPYSDLDDLPF